VAAVGVGFWFVLEDLSSSFLQPIRESNSKLAHMVVLSDFIYFLLG
jgi:hypothetical protein